jgi:RimJ/RimL family protein N-acetyltransferase
MEINGDPEVTRFLPYATWKTLADAEAWLERMDSLSRKTGSRQLVVVRSADDKVVGTALVFNFDEASRRVELGYVIGRTYWRQGYAREMLRTLLHHLFEVLVIRRVEAQVNPGNVASTSLLRDLGFTLEGHLRERYEDKGVVYGVNFYGMLAGEWRQTGG